MTATQTAEEMSTMFEREWQTYTANKSALLDFEGDFVVIRGDEILGHYPSTTEAFDAGVRAYGPERFFLHQISRDEKTLYNPFIGSVSEPQASAGYLPLQMPTITGPSGLVPGSDPRQILARFGPRVPIRLSMPKAQAQSIMVAGGVIPNPAIGHALIDTGANNTCIDDAIAKALGLRAIGNVTVNTPAGQANQLQYVVEVDLAGQGNGLWTVTGAELAAQGIVALIGTDVLYSAVFVFDGLNGTFSLSF